MLTTSWIWLTDQGVNGLRIDKDNHIMKWYDVVGCGCGMDDSAVEQTVSAYLEKGSPITLSIPPEDVLVEIQESIKVMTL